MCRGVVELQATSKRRRQVHRAPFFEADYCSELVEPYATGRAHASDAMYTYLRVFSVGRGALTNGGQLRPQMGSRCLRSASQVACTQDLCIFSRVLGLASYIAQRMPLGPQGNDFARLCLALLERQTQTQLERVSSTSGHRSNCVLLASPSYQS